MHLNRSILALICLQPILGSSIKASIPISIQYAEGNQTNFVPQENLTILNLNPLYLTYLDEILTSNPDIICVSKPLGSNVVLSLYQKLVHTYTHFYQIASQHSPEEVGLFVASRYPIEDLQCTDWLVGEGQTRSTFFDFVIKHSETPLAHFYISADNTLVYPDQILKKMNIDFSLSKERIIPFFLSESLTLSKGIKTIPLFISDNTPCAFLTTVSKNNSLDIQNWKNVLCKATSDQNHGYVEYEFSVKEDNDGNTNARGEIDYTKENEDSRFSVGIEAKLDKDSSGDTKASVEAKVKGRY